MSEMTPKLPQELEQALKEYYSAPAPSAEFASRLEAHLRDRLEQTQSTQNKSERKTLMMTLRARPALAILIALLILLALSGVVYAIGSSFGYIPGLGVVDQNAPFRILEKPVSQTRDGITVTVKEAVISSEKTIITLTIENVLSDKLSPNENINDATCRQWPELRLLNGMLLNLTGGINVARAHEMRLIYEPMPADTNDATLSIPCIDRATPGALPENWELPLRFIPAPPNMTVIPVMEFTTVSASGTAEKSASVVTKAIDTGDGYILVGELQAPPPPGQRDSGVFDLKVTDGNNQDVPYELFPPEYIGMAAPTSPNAEVWSVKFSKGFVPPIHVTYAKQYIFADPSQETVEFEFDAGENPQTIQTWQLVNKEFTFAGRSFTLLSIAALPSNFYVFNFTSTDSRIYSVDVAIDGYPPDAMRGGMDAGVIGGTSDAWGVPVGPYRELPRGKLKVILSRLWLTGEIKDWTIDWQP